MHLRRALLLFAIVLGMAALVASLSRPIEDRRGESTTPTETAPGPETAAPGPPTGGTAELPKTVVFEASRNESKKLEAGTAATVEVEVSEAGTVDIPDMGLTDVAEPTTPAQFDVLATRPGRYPLLFTRAGGEQTAEPAGILVVTSRG